MALAPSSGQKAGRRLAVQEPRVARVLPAVLPRRAVLALRVGARLGLRRVQGPVRLPVLVLPARGWVLALRVRVVLRILP